MKILIYLLAFTLSNFIVVWFGSTGLIFTALFLIPFDFVMRCYFHEKWTGFTLVRNLVLICVAASVITYLINRDSLNIALGSVCAFASAQLFAGVFYQMMKQKSYFIKVNGSDMIGILVDSVIFQIVAFGTISPWITVTQFGLKVIGGLFWYWIIFVKFNNRNNDKERTQRTMQ